MIVFCRGNILRAADVVPSSSTISNTTTVLLEYQETDHAIIDWGVSIALQSAPFNKEPAAASGKIVRGILNFGGGSSNAIPFLWQRGAGKLFLDLNRNRDLTDDPAGVFSESLGPTRSAYYQTFTNVHLIFNTLSGKCPVLADIRFWDYGSQPGGNIDIALRSFWQGKVTLQGRDWQVGIVQNVLNESGWFENGRLLLRPWEERNQPFNAYDGSLATVPFSRKLFVDGHACQLDLVAGPQGGEAKPALQFTEQSAALGELKITGKYIQRLVLTGGPYLVILDQPMDTVKVPTGSYNQPEVRIEQNAAEAYRDSNQPQLGARIKVEDKTPVVLNAGGPLTNSVIASRHGQDLRLDYRLIGAGGATYQLVKQDRSRPPEFAVYKSDRKIESGKFEFG
ncbi:MAG: hypothetical protein ABSA45_01810 [Verrucomicrobiota bacterium]